MMTILQSLKSLSSYPIPTATLQDAAEGLGFEIDAEATTDVRKSKSFKQAQAKVYEFLADAPNVSQGGISFSFTDDERKCFRLRADNLLEEAGNISNSGIKYGYMGENL
jgi:hypothetical protein